MLHRLPRSLVAALGALLSACFAAEHDASSTAEAIVNDAGPAPEAAPEAELPPAGTAQEMEAWLAAGHYRSWTCETDAHAARPPSGHSPNRICSNALASAHGAGEYPVGAASVKELYDDAQQNVIGYAVARKLGAGGGESWYWYERIDGAGVVAAGKGDDGAPKRICVRCHARAGASTFGHDAVFTQVH